MSRKLIDEANSLPLDELFSRFGMHSSKRNAKGPLYVCPFHDDHDPSLQVFENDNRWQCWACGVVKKPSTGTDFVMERENIKTPKEAAAWILGEAVADPEKAPKKYATKASVKLEVVPHQQFEGEILGTQPFFNPPKNSRFKAKVILASEYISYDGEVLGYEMRLRFEKDEDWFPAFCAWDGHQWVFTRLEKPQPIYNWMALADHPEATVVVLEGSKKPDIYNALEIGGTIAVGFPYGGKNWPHVDWEPLRERTVTLLPDNDFFNGGVHHFQDLAKHLRENLDCVVDIVDPPTEVSDRKEATKGWNLDDYLKPHQHGGLGWNKGHIVQWMAEMSRANRAKIAEAEKKNEIPQYTKDYWRKDAIKDKDGKPLPKNPYNVTLFLTLRPEYHMAYRMNLHSKRLEWTRRVPGIPSSNAGVEVEAEDFVAIAIQIAKNSPLVTYKDQVRDLMVSATRTNEWQYHPVHDYLNRVVWDHRSRLDTMLVDYCGADDTLLNRALGAKWMISAVKRAFVPGCDAPNILVLEGDQGIGKSSFFRILANDEKLYLPDLRADEDRPALRCEGKWIVEIAEMSGLSKADKSRFKAFVTTNTDRVKRPYGSEWVEIPRQFIIGATVNPIAGYLDDATGNRRFWPVAVRKVKMTALERDRDQLWAEAVYRFKGREDNHLPKELDEEAREATEARALIDSWEDDIIEWLQTSAPPKFSMRDVLWDCLKITIDRQDRRAVDRAASILKKLKSDNKKSNGVMRWTNPYRRSKVG